MVQITTHYWDKHQDLVLFDQRSPKLCPSDHIYTPNFALNDLIDLYDPGNDLETQISRWHPPHILLLTIWMIDLTWMPAINRQRRPKSRISHWLVNYK